MTSGGMDKRRRGTRSRNSRAQDIEGTGAERGTPAAKVPDTGHRGTEVRAMMREKCTEESRHSMPGNGHTKKGKPAFNAGEWKKKAAEYRGEQNIRKRRDVDVRNGREMVAGLTRKWASTTPVPSP